MILSTGTGKVPGREGRQTQGRGHYIRLGKSLDSVHEGEGVISRPDLK